MADVKMPDSVPCKFDAKGWAPCKKPSTNGLCSKHEKTKCCSCGEQALRSCEEGMGGLSCGAPLCNTCQHSMEGGGVHVTKAVHAVQMKEELELQKTGKESKRMLALRGVRTDVELPRHVGDIIDKALTSFNLKVCYLLLIDSGHAFPAILKDTRIPVITLDKSAAIRVLQSLRPKKFKIQANAWMVNEELGVCYHMTNDSFDRTQSRPHKLFTAEEIDTHFKKTKEPFVWAPGLFEAETSKDHFESLIKQELAA